MGPVIVSITKAPSCDATNRSLRSRPTLVVVNATGTRGGASVSRRPVARRRRCGRSDELELRLGAGCDHARVPHAGWVCAGGNGFHPLAERGTHAHEKTQGRS